MGAANGGAQPPTEIRAFLIADIRGYTVFTNERGDDAAGRLAALFAAVVREEVEPFDGDLLELRGDEALVVFTSPRQAIRAAVRLQDRCIDETLADPSMPLTVGIGLDAGEAVAVEGGYRGGALNLAARLCSKARAGEVLASQGILHLARRVEGIAYRDAGQLELKGLDEPVRVSLVAPVGADRSHLVAVYVPRPPSRRRRGRVAVAVVALVAVVAGGVAAVVAATGGDDGQAAATSPAASRPASPTPASSPTSAPTFGLGAEHIDPTTNAIVGTAEFAADGQEVVIADGFVWSLEAQHPNVNLVKIAPDRAVVVGELTGKVFFHPTGAAGHVFSYVVDGSNFSFSRVDPRTNEPISLIQPRLGGAQGVASENGRVWWGIPWDGTGPFDPGIIRFDTATGRERLIPVKDPDPFVCDREGGCRANAIAAGEGGVWFITSSHTLDRLDPKTHEVEPVPVDAATSVAVGLGSVWIADNTSTPGVVREYAPSTGKVVEEYEVGANPTAIAVGAGAVWVVNRDNGTLSRIDPEANEVAATIDVGLGARAVAADDELGVWVVR